MSDRARVRSVGVLFGLVAGVVTLARAQPPAEQRVGLEVPACDAPWLRFEELAPALRVELRASGIDATVLRADDLSTFVVVRTGACDALRLTLEAREGDREVSREIGLFDVAPANRTRTVAIALADLWNEARLAEENAHATVEDPAEPERSAATGVELRIERVSSPAVASSELAVDPALVPAVDSARDLGDPRPGEREDAGDPRDRVSLSASGSIVTALEDPHAFAGGGASLTIPLARIGGGPRLGAEIGIDALYAERHVELGTAALVVPSLRAGLGVTFPIDAWEIGALVEAAPGLGVSLGRTSRNDVMTVDAVDFVIELRALAQLRIPLASGWFVRADAGIGLVARGVVLRVEGERVFGLSMWTLPVRIAAGVSL